MGLRSISLHIDDLRRFCDDDGDAGNVDSEVVDGDVANMDVDDDVFVDASEIEKGERVRTSVGAGLSASFRRSGSKGDDVGDG